MIQGPSEPIRFIRQLFAKSWKSRSKLDLLVYSRDSFWLGMGDDRIRRLDLSIGFGNYFQIC
jgi:hypothetical protein